MWGLWGVWEGPDLAAKIVLKLKKKKKRKNPLRARIGGRQDRPLDFKQRKRWVRKGPEFSPGHDPARSPARRAGRRGVPGEGRIPPENAGWEKKKTKL